MIEYNDVAKINALYNENEMVNQAINLLDNGGKVTNFMVSPPPSPPASSMSGMPMPMAPMMMMAVSITIPPPGAQDQFNQAAREQLVSRSAAIVQELATLGVTNPPAARTGKAIGAPTPPATDTAKA